MRRFTMMAVLAAGTMLGVLRAPGNRCHFSRLVVGRVSQR